MQITFSSEDMKPLIDAVVASAVQRLAEFNAVDDRIAINEAEAARLLSMESHQLRDERRRGRITASRIVNRRIRYTRQDLFAYLERGRINIE